LVRGDLKWLLHSEIQKIPNQRLPVQLDFRGGVGRKLRMLTLTVSRMTTGGFV
jgi:hypothetical protein